MRKSCCSLGFCVLCMLWIFNLYLAKVYCSVIGDWCIHIYAHACTFLLKIGVYSNIHVCLYTGIPHFP